MRILIFLIICFVFGSIYAAYWLLRFRFQMKTYGKRLRNFYIFSESPTDRSLVTRAKEHERWLARSGNQSGVQVLIIPFQDKFHPLETWEEYLVRRKEEQRLDMIARDTEIEKRKGREYYLSEIHEQDNDLQSDLIETLQGIQNGFAKASARMQKYRAYLREVRRRIDRKLQRYRSR